MRYTEASQAPDTKPGNYYVTAVRDDGAVAWLAGPFKNDHAGALAALPKAKRVAMDIDPRAPWYAYGTSRIDLSESAPSARLEGI